MKVLILATDIFTRGGIARHTYTFAATLADLLGPDNVDVCALLSYGDPSELHPQFRVLGCLSARLTAAAKARFTFQALELARQRYDLVVCSHLHLAPVAALIRFVYHTPYWVACYGTEAWAPLPLFTRAALRRADLVLPMSRFTAQKLVEVHGIPPRRSAIVYTTVPDHLEKLLTACGDAGEAKTRGGRRELTLLSVGNLTRFHTHKGFDIVIRALPRILASIPCVHYVIAGGGDNLPNLERLAAEVGVAGRVSFAGEVPDAELAALYRNCDVFVMPSGVSNHGALANGEGFGRVYVEAALAGKPAVGSRYGGAAEAVLDGKTGLLVNPGSPQEVADAVIALLGNPDTAAGMGAAGRRWALENFTQAALRRRLAQMLDERKGF